MMHLIEPERRKIYHITHVDNLASIIADEGLVSDAEIVRRGGSVREIGMPAIKRRRVKALEVPCHPGTKVGDYIPFYFCPRSVMLFLIHKRNHPELSYRGGQEPIVHLEADVGRVVRWAEGEGALWAFSLMNAGSYYAEFRTGSEQLASLDWGAIAATDFRDPDTKERKQAEFLVYRHFPFSLVDRIGVKSTTVSRQVTARLTACSNSPTVEVRRTWYC